MKHRAYGTSAVGKHKKENQDALLVESKLGLYMVCDGIGGRAAGNVASTTTCTLMKKFLLEHRDVLEAYKNKGSTTNRNQANMVVRSVVDHVNAEIFKMGHSNARLQGMASTFVMLMMLGRNAIVAHAGDSRVYLIRGGTAYLLTDDHSVVKRQLKRGLITAEDALHGAHASLVTRAMGMNMQLEPDLLNVELMPGDMFMLCTDGLTRYITTDEIARAAVTFTWEKTPETLVKLADKRAGKDNITAVMVAVDPNQKVRGLDAGQKIDALRMIPLFQNLSYHESIRILSIISSREYRKGEQIIKQGTQGREFFVGVTGRFRVEIGGQKLVTLSNGSIFGAMVLLTETTHQMDVFAREDSIVLVIDKEDFFNLLRHDPYLGNKLLWGFCKMIGERLMRTGQQFAKLKFQIDGLSPQEISDLAGISGLSGDVTEAAGKAMRQAQQKPRRSPRQRVPGQP